MDITICENLKQYRKCKGNTQEDLAEHLGISIQAVSKWERNEGFPDITLLPKIAMYYNVSVDDLLGVGKIRMDEKVAEYHAQSDVYQRKGEFDSDLALWTEAIKEFPNNYDVMNGYMISLYQKNQTCANPEEYADKIIEIGERLFKEADEPYYRYEVIWILCRLYNLLGNEDKAKEYAWKAPQMDITKDNLFPFILKGEEAVKRIQGNLCGWLDLIERQIRVMIREGNFNIKETRKARQKCLKLFELIFEDGDYGYYCTRISVIYADLASCDAMDGNADDVIKNLALSAEYAIKFMTQRGFQRTSFLVNRTSHEDGHTGYPNTTDNECKTLLKILKQPQLDFCREDERFIEIERNLTEYAN